MRIFKHRNLLGCLFAIILAMPLINIGVRCAYTIFNKNAKDSYSDDKQITDITQVNNLVVGNRYSFRNFGDITSTGSTGSVSNNFITYEDVKLTYELNNTTNNLNIINSVKLGFYKVEGNSYFSLFYYDEDNQSNTLSTGVGYYSFEFTLTSVHYNVDFIQFFNNQNTFQEISINNTLDNAFDYSISKITESNNIGELKFFTWFADIFLDLDNPSNALYINFINWYFNYALLVSAVYILFLALMWFIMWVRRLLERGMDFGNRSW